MDIYTLPFSAQEIEEKLNRVDTNTDDIATLFNTITPTREDHSEYFIIDSDGYIALKPEYRGVECSTWIKDGEQNYSTSDNGSHFAGSLNEILPSHLYIPLFVNNTPVKGLQKRAFANNLQIEEVTLHDNITTLPMLVFYGANKLVNINETDHITNIGQACIAFTALTNLNLLALNSSDSRSLMKATYLQQVHLSNTINELPANMFFDCISLIIVTGCGKVASVGANCFKSTRKLQSVDLPETAQIASDAFFNSLLQNKEYYSNTLNPGNYQSNAPYVTLNQLDRRWANAAIGKSNLFYNNGCGYFSIMHVQALLSNKYYMHPQEFINELYNNPSTQEYVTVADKALSKFQYQVEFWKQSQYYVDILNEFNPADIDNSPEFTEEKYDKLCWALSKGAAAIITCGAKLDQPHHGHYVVLYGLYKNNNKTYMYVLDSIARPTEYQVSNTDDNALSTYLMPYENITGAKSGCIIIYPNKTVKDEIDIKFSSEEE